MLRAVAIGIDRYKDENISPLSYACADAEAFRRLLEQRIHPSDRAVMLLTNEQATRRNIQVAIGEDLARVTQPEDVILLYFAGHGSPETDGSPDQASRYLVAYDTEYERIYATGIDMERDLNRWFERFVGTQLIALFVDACFSGRAGGRTFEGPQLARSRTGQRGEPIRLREMELGSGRLMITACDDDQVARETSTFGHGVFTHFLLQELSQPEVQEATITLSRLYDETARHVREYTGGRQVPVLNGRNVNARLPLLRP